MAQKPTKHLVLALNKYVIEVGLTFWMDRYLASDPVEFDHSLALLGGVLRPDDLYAVFGSFEGEWEVMRFSSFQLQERVPQVKEVRASPDVASESQEWNSSLARAAYISYVDQIRREIARGWVYQVNACRLLRSHASLDLQHLFSLIQEQHHAPAAGYYRSENWEIASASPETFFRVDIREGVRRITTSPIKGTSPDGNFGEKDSAENVMIVDLMRNDISPLCELGSVRVPRLLAKEEHPGLVHLVSDVTGQLRADVSWKEILERLMPAGSISGAPKSSALEMIKHFEPYRGAYCGTLGWIHRGQAHFNVLIRSFFKDRKRDPYVTLFGTGAGITWGSDGEGEWLETELKAKRLISIAGSAGAGSRR